MDALIKSTIEDKFGETRAKQFFMANDILLTYNYNSHLDELIDLTGTNITDDPVNSTLF